MHLARLVLLFLGVSAVAASLLAHRPSLLSHRCGKNCAFVDELSSSPRPGFLNTTVRWFEQAIDHFSYAPTPTGSRTFSQRFLTYDGFFNPKDPVIFFYTGNEGSVELYANSSGLMWENAERFGALLVFAEHRYYGKSLPFGDESFLPANMGYLTAEQALADYAVLIHAIKKEIKAEHAPVIAFGGSYGGMLSSWLRMKYPAAIDGAIAASAPILAFADEDESSLAASSDISYWNSEKYWNVVTIDATAARGADSRCASTVSSAWPVFFAAARTESGRKKLGDTFQLCQPLKDEAAAIELAEMVKYSFDTLAMGNYPFPSSYLTAPGYPLPPFPMREACTQLMTSFDASTKRGAGQWSVIEGLAAGAGVYTNFTGAACLHLPEDVEEDGIWDFQWCTEMQPQETYFSCDGSGDMFWPEYFNYTFVQSHCQHKYNVSPRPSWIRTVFGGMEAVKQASNIVFSNGNMDPWSAGGVRVNVSESVVAIEIEDGAHHLDLMFSTPYDPPSVQFAREFELAHVEKWIEEAKKRRSGGK